MPVKVTKQHFSGASRVFENTATGLGAVIQGLAQDLARRELSLANLPEMTDNTTGTIGNALTALSVSLAAFTETGTASTPKAGFDTAIGKIASAQAVFARFFNRTNSRLGLPLIVDNTGGTVATAGTLPALDKTTTAVSSLCVDRTTALARLSTIRDNMAVLVRNYNRLAYAVGGIQLAETTGGSVGTTNTLAAIANTGASNAGAAGATLQNSVTNTQLTAIADNLATLSIYVNRLIGAAPTDLTNSAGGTASNTLAAQAAPAAFTTATASDCAPKAGFDTEVGKWNNNFSDLVTRYNELAVRRNLPVLKNSTGVSANTTVEAVLAALAGTNGGTGCIDRTSALTALTGVRNNFTTLATYINRLVALYPGTVVLTDSTGGTVSPTLDIVAIATTGTGNDGTANQTIADAVMDALLAVIQNSFTSLAAKLNEITGAEVEDRPLSIVAWKN